MASNASLKAARKAKNDEFYTRYEDVEKEVSQYDSSLFEDKIIFCSCDDSDSAFYKYFDNNFEKLKIKKLICTRYYKKMTGEDRGKFYIIEAGENGKKYSSGELEGDGDFRSAEIKKLFAEADILVTNPPFSLFREFISQLIEYGKKFLIIGNYSAVLYKNICLLFKDNKMRYGYSFPDAFEKPNGKLVKNINSAWFTNLEDSNSKKQSIVLCEKYYSDNGAPLQDSAEKYPRFDDYDAIYIDTIKNIPYDYIPCWYKCQKADICDYAKKEGQKKANPLCDKHCNGKMAVPFTFFSQYFLRGFEVVDIPLRLKVNGEEKFTRIIIQQKKFDKKPESDIDIVYKKIEEITPYENNPRKNDNAVDAVAESIKQFGWKVPIVIDKDNVIVAGHTRYKAAQKLGITEVPCIVADDLTEEQVTAFRIADNKVSEYAEWDYELLKNELSEIKIDMKPLGMSLSEIPSYDELFTEAEPKDKETKKRVYTCPCCGKEFEL